MKYSNQTHTAAQDPSPLLLFSENHSTISLMVGIIWETDSNSNCPKQLQCPRATTRHIGKANVFNSTWTGKDL